MVVHYNDYTVTLNARISSLRGCVRACVRYQKLNGRYRNFLLLS